MRGSVNSYPSSDLYMSPDFVSFKSALCTELADGRACFFIKNQSFDSPDITRNLSTNSPILPCLLLRKAISEYRVAHRGS